MIIQQVIEAKKRPIKKPTQTSLRIRLKEYCKAFIKRSNPRPESKRPPVKWSTLHCRAHSLQKPAELSDDLRRSLFGLAPVDDKDFKND